MRHGIPTRLSGRDTCSHVAPTVSGQSTGVRSGLRAPDAVAGLGPRDGSRLEGIAITRRLSERAAPTAIGGAMTDQGIIERDNAQVVRSYFEQV